MNVPYSWLLEFLPALEGKLDELTSGEVATDVAAQRAQRVAVLADLLTNIGLAVERVYDLPPPPSGVVVARVESVLAIEGSEHLLHALVFDGEVRYKVVTGAPNTKVGMLTALAKPGTALPGAGFTVSKREMMGVQSEGVLCSPKELGLYEYGGGLLQFGEDAPVGAELCALWPAETVLKLELTPNRADAFSLLGVARDLSAKLGISLRHPAEGLETGDPRIDDGLQVEIRDLEACPRFTLRLIEGVGIAPSPLWLQRRLVAVGLRPRNNVVDVTNYVTFELGQPSHAYDRADLIDGTIVVRRAEAGETLTALNEERLEFSPNDLLITTPKAKTEDGDTLPIGLAGIIGGLHHSVKGDTQNVALEVAHFDPVTVRKGAKRSGLSTEAHYRFERGVDPNLPPLASARAASLVAEVAGGRVHPGLTEVGGDKPLGEIVFQPSRVEFLMAVAVPLELQKRYLEALGCTVEGSGEDEWRVTVPSWRFDLSIAEDLIEEVMRLHGFEHIPETIPNMHFVPTESDSTHRGLRTLLAGAGLQETISYIFTSDDALERAAAPEAAVRLQSPPSVERSVLRTALYPGLLNAAATNRSAEGLALFEIGRTFREEETERLGILMNGLWTQGGWLPDTPVDFFVFKGVLERLAQTLGAELRFTPRGYPHLHPGVSAMVLWNGREVGWAGRLHPEVAARYELPESYLAELGLPLEAAEIEFRDVERQPFAERDLAIIAPEEVTYAALYDLVSGAAGERLESLSPFDVYGGSPIPEGERSVALRLRFRHPERALRDEEVDSFMTNIISALSEKGYSIRE